MSEPLRVLVNGARGRMGRLTVSVVQAAPDLLLCAETDLDDDLGSSILETGAQVVIDFTHHSVALHCFEEIVAAGARPVSGTSGFSEAEVETARALVEAADSSGMIIPNFSLGAVLMMQFAAKAAALFPHVEVVEMHHDRKGDAPSGTAQRTAEIIARARSEVPAPKVQEIERVPGARGGRVAGVPVHSIRLPGALAHQEVLFSGPGEILTIRHDSLSRESFEPGILLAVRSVSDWSGLAYGLDALL